jgi:hypothetical protein
MVNLWPETVSNPRIVAVLFVVCPPKYTEEKQVVAKPDRSDIDALFPIATAASELALDESPTATAPACVAPALGPIATELPPDAKDVSAIAVE